MENHINLKAQGKEIFQKVFNDIASSWNTGDRIPYVNAHGDQCIYMLPHGELLIGRKAINDFVLSFPEVIQEYSIVEVFGHPDLSVVRGSFILKSLEGELMDKGKFLTVCKLGNMGEWTITHAIWNSDLPLPE